MTDEGRPKMPAWLEKYPFAVTEEEIEAERIYNTFIGPHWRPTLDSIWAERGASIGAPEPIPTNKMGQRMVEATPAEKRELMEQIDFTKWCLRI